MERYEFGTRVAQLRKTKGITQAQLAEMLSVSNKTISRWETGDGYPDISLLKPLAIALGVSIDYLLGNEDDNCMAESVPTHIEVSCPDDCGAQGQSDQYRAESEQKGPVIKDKPFDWRHPRWRDLTPLNKVAAATLLIMIAYQILYWLLIIVADLQAVNIFVVINAVLIKYLPITGIICATISLVRGEKGLSYRQRNVSRVLLAANIFIPLIIFLMPLAFL